MKDIYKGSKVLISILIICSSFLTACIDKGINNEETFFDVENSISNTENNSESLKLFSFDESKVTILDENDYADAEVLSETDVLLLYKPVVNISEAYSNVCYKSIELPENFSSKVNNIDDIWFVSYNFGDEYKICSYNPENGETNIIIDPEENYCSVCCAKDNYLIWNEDEDNNFLSPKYHVYNINDQSDIVFYESALDPSTGASYYGLHFNKPVIINNKIYYDDVVDIDENHFSHKIVYSYDIHKKKLDILYDDAMWPLEYMNKPAWYSLSEDRENAVLCNENGGIFKLATLLGSDAFSSKELIVIHDNMSENTFNTLAEGKTIDTDIDIYTGLPEDEASTSHGIKIFQNGKAEPILLTGNNVVAYAANVSTNGRFVCWSGYKIGNPMFYDSEKDSIVKVDFLENLNIDMYTFDFYGDDLLLSYWSNSDNSEAKHILIRLS